MPSIFLTRPKEDSERLALELARIGYESMVEPLLTIQPVFAPPPDLGNLQAVMLTSAHALDFLDKQICVAGDLFKLSCFCVGSNTAAAAEAFGFCAVQNMAGDGLVLAEHVSKTLDARNGGILHISGRDTDSRGREALERQGFTVKIWTTYAAEAAKALSVTAIQAFRDAKIDAVLLFSTRTAETLKTLVAVHGLEACCRNVIALGISDTVRATLGALPWCRLEAASQPSEEAVLQRLQEILPVPEVP